MVRLHLQSNHNAKKHMITHQAQTSKFVVRLDPHNIDYNDYIYYLTTQALSEAMMRTSWLTPRVHN